MSWARGQLAVAHLLPHAKSSLYKASWGLKLMPVGTVVCRLLALSSVWKLARLIARHRLAFQAQAAVKSFLKTALSGMAAQEVKDVETCIAGERTK